MKLTAEQITIRDSSHWWEDNQPKWRVMNGYENYGFVRFVSYLPNDPDAVRILGTDNREHTVFRMALTETVRNLLPKRTIV